MELHTAFRLSLALLGMIFGIIASLLFRELNTETDTAMAKFQLSPEKAVREFELLLSGTALMMMGFFAYMLGGYFEASELLSIGRIIAVTFALIPITTFYRWWRRF